MMERTPFIIERVMRLLKVMDRFAFALICHSTWRVFLSCHEEVIGGFVMARKERVTRETFIKKL